MNFEQWRLAAVSGEPRLFSLARHGLVAALQLHRIGHGDRVLLPEFICRDVLSALEAVGAEPVWYEVGPDLRPARGPPEWPAARAVIAVNYFGFAQPLEAFRDYAKRHGAVLIEDNAHGFLSRDEEGRWLGTRGDVGLFSLRKTLPISDGALVVVNGEAGSRLPPQLPQNGPGFSPATPLKAKIRRWPLIGAASQVVLTDLMRAVKRKRDASRKTPDDDCSEHEMPIAAAPHSGLAAELAHLDVEKEVARRRKLYADASARALGIVPLFPSVPEGVSPYGFAFRCRESQSRDGMKAWARSNALDLISWPDLPRAVQTNAPDWYRDICLVNFL